MSKRLGKLANRYAKAFLGSVGASGAGAGQTEAQAAAEGLLLIAKLWQEDPQLASVITNPIFNATERRKGLESVAKFLNLSDVTVRFLRVLFERDRIAALPEIAQVFSELADDAASVVQVSIITARQVDELERREIEGGLAAKIEGRPAYSWSVDAALLGGMIIRYRGNMIDGSLAGRLQTLEKRLAG